MVTRTVSSLKMIFFYKINLSCASYAVPLIRNYLEQVVPFMHTLFIYDEELKWGIQGYSLCLLDNQLKVAIVVKSCARIYYVRTLFDSKWAYECNSSDSSESWSDRIRLI